MKNVYTMQCIPKLHLNTMYDVYKWHCFDFSLLVYKFVKLLFDYACI